MKYLVFIALFAMCMLALYRLDAEKDSKARCCPLPDSPVAAEI